MRYLTRLLIGLLLCSTSAYAQQQTRPASRSEATVLSASDDTFILAVEGYATARIQTLDSYSGTWEVQCSLDGGTTFDTDDEVPVVQLGGTSSTDVSDTVGIWDANIAGCSHIKIAATAGFAATDTTMRIVLFASGGGAGGSSGAVTGEVTVTGTTNVDIVGINGVAPLASYANATLQSAATANGDGTSLSVRGYSGVLFTIRCTVACSGGTTITLKASEDGTRYETLTRAVRIGNAGTYGGVILNQADTDDSLWYATVDGAQAVLAVISGYSAGTITVTATAVLGGGPGAVTLTSQKNEDAAHTSADPGLPVWTRRLDNANATSAGTNGDYATLDSNAYGALITALTDPCSSEPKVTVGFSIAADGEFIDGTASQKTYICAWWFVAGAAEQVSIVSEDDDGSCNKTSGVALVGSTTDSEGPSFAANGGVASGSGAASVLVSDTAGDDLCIYLNGTNRVAGTVTYVKRVP